VRVTLGFALSVLVLWLSQPTRDTILVGFAIALVGEAIRFWAAGHLNKSIEVTASGPYRWVAHPLYLGSTLMGMGLAFASGRLFVAIVVGVYLGLTLTAAVQTEEAFLSRTFGSRYDSYRRGATNVTSRGDRRFSLEQAIVNREHRAVVGLAIAVLLLTLKATYNGSFWR
jgi:protein-S-isoprenylcysteine O-methyltransferase Ste14